jgi:hypothetical protein
MDPRFLTAISAQVYRQFPELAGVRPKVRPQTGPLAKGSAVDTIYLLTYEGTACAADGQSIHRVVRVTASNQGKILKLSTSR